MKFIPKGMSFKEYEESYTVRHIADTVGIAYLLMLAFQFLLGSVFIDIMIKAGISPNKIREWFEDPALTLVVNVLITAVVFTVPFILAAPRERRPIRELIYFESSKKKLFLPLVMMGSGACLASNIAAGIISSILGSIGITDNEVFDSLPNGMWGFALAVVAVSLAPAVLEEFAWRGITFGLLKRTGEGFALITSAVMFGVMHANITQIPFGFFSGIFIGFAYIKSKSLWTAMTVHAINNFTAIAMDYMLGSASEEANALVSAVIIAFFALMAVYGLLLYVKRGGDFLLDKGEISMGASKKAACFIKSPYIIASIIGTVILMLIG